MSRWSVLARWTFASVVAWATGLVLDVTLTLAVASVGGLNPDRLQAYAVLLSVALTTGAVQRRMIARYLPHSARWLPATVMGFVPGFFIMSVYDGVTLPLPGMWRDALLLALVGGLVGMGQWWVLRQHYRHSGLWIVATSAGMLSFL